MVQPSRIQWLYRRWAEPPGQVIAAAASASMTGGRQVPSPGPLDALGLPV